MDKAILGDNPFFGVNHASDEKARAQSIQFKTDKAIIRVLDQAIEAGIRTFMCTTHDRIANICEHIRNAPAQYENFKIYPCMPYAHKYANAVTDLGILGAMKQYVPGNLFGTIAVGGMAFIGKDYLKLIKILIDSEMKAFRGIDTPVIFLQNVIVDMLLGFGMLDIFKFYDSYIREKYRAEPGYITMNMPMLLNALNSAGIENPIICSSINKIGFRMSGGRERYELYLRDRAFRAIAMQVLAAGSLPPAEAVQYLADFPRIGSVLFGASSRNHIAETKRLIESAL